MRAYNRRNVIWRPKIKRKAAVPSAQRQMPGPSSSAAAAAAAKTPAPHYATLGELHSKGLAGLAERNPDLLAKIEQFGGADAAVEPGISGATRPSRCHRCPGLARACCWHLRTAHPAACWWWFPQPCWATTTSSSRTCNIIPGHPASHT